MGAGLARHERVRRRAEFVRLQARPAIRVRGPGFLLLASRAVEAHPTPPAGGSQSALPQLRLGVIASRKVGNAVARNRCKRLLRELFRRNKAAFPAGFDILLVAFAELVSLDYAALEAGARAPLAELARRAARLPIAPPALASEGGRGQAAATVSGSPGRRGGLSRG